MKTCGRCGEPKPLLEFTRRSAVKSGYGSWCLVCASGYSKTKYNRNPTEGRKRVQSFRESNPSYSSEYQRNRRKFFPEKVKDAQLRHKYGISIDDWNRMFKQQKGACAICKAKKVCLCVDHNHRTGAVRELLCAQCNYAIAHLKDSATLALEAARYLKRHSLSGKNAGEKQ